MQNKSSNSTPTQKQTGFTLIELMITVAILVMLVAVAAPSFNNFILQNSVTSETNHLLSTLRYARGQAIANKAPVQVCRSNADQTACGAGNNGFLVIQNGNVMSATSPSPNGVVINDWNNLTFDSDGSTAASNITVTDNDTNSSVISVRITGLARIN